MRQNFDRCFDLVVGSEGTYDDDPDDRGNWTSGRVGEGQLNGTKYGIAAFVYPNLDIKRLSLERAKEIYRKDYWGDFADTLPSGLDYLWFDICVNNGRRQANILLQRGLDVDADGIIGPKTLAAISEADMDALINAVSYYRIPFYKKLKMFWKYGRGWLNRVERVRLDALKMTKETV